MQAASNFVTVEVKVCVSIQLYIHVRVSYSRNRIFVVSGGDSVAMLLPGRVQRTVCSMHAHFRDSFLKFGSLRLILARFGGIILISAWIHVS